MPDAERFRGRDVGPPAAAVVGCGSAGCHALRNVTGDDVLRLAVNDAPHPALAGLPHRVLLADSALRAVAELDDRVVPDLHTEAERDLARHLAGRELVVVLAGLGGHTGGYAANAVARVANHVGAVSLATVSLPFRYEGSHRRQLAEEALARLRGRPHGLVVLPNDGLRRIAPNLSLARALGAMARLLVLPAEELLAALGRRDLPLLAEVLAPCREIRLGVGKGDGPHRAFVAAEEAFRSPWFDVPVERSRAAVAVVAHGTDDAARVDETARELRKRLPVARLAVGAYADPDLAEALRLTVLLGP